MISLVPSRALVCLLLTLAIVAHAGPSQKLKEKEKLILKTISKNHFSVSNVQDQIQMIPERGVLLEPAGQYHSYSGYSLVPIIYTIPKIDIKGDNKTFCPTNNILNTVYTSMVDRIYNNIKPQKKGRPMKGKPVREKRFIPIIMGGVAALGQLGYDMYNIGEVKSLQSMVGDLRDSNEEISAKIGLITDTSNIMIKDMKKLSVIVGDNTASIVAMANQLSCMALETTPEFHVLLAQLADIPPEFMAAYDNMLAGRVVPELISMQNLQFTIESHPELKNSIYSHDPSLVYELGKTILIDVLYGKTPALKGVILVPKILNQSPIPMYNLYTVNYIHKGTNFRIVLPKKMVCRSITECWELPSDQCISSMTRSICLQGHHRQIDKCLLSIHTNQTLDCNIMIGKEEVDPVIYQLGAGVFSGSLSSPIKGVDIVGDSIVYKGTYTVNTPRLFTSRDAPFLLINDDVYSTRISGVQFNITLVYTDTPHSSVDPPSDMSKDWIPLEQIPTTWKSHMHAPVSTLSGLSFFLMATVMLTMLIILGFFFVNRRVTKKTRPIYLSPQTPNLMQEIPYLR